MKLDSFEAGAVAGVPSAPGTPSVGNPTNGDPLLAIPATTPGAYWFYQLQKEIDKVLTDAGLTPDAATLTQLSQAIGILAAGNLGLAHASFQYATAATVKLARQYASKIKIEIDGKVIEHATDLTFAWGDLDTGSETASTFYYCYVEDVSGVLTPHISATAPETSANKVGYHPTNTTWRYVGAFRNNASSNIDPFDALGNQVFFRTNESERVHTLGSAIVATAWTSQAVVLPKTASSMILNAQIAIDDLAFVYGRSDAIGTLPASGNAFYADSGMEGVLMTMGGESGTSGSPSNDAAQFVIPVADKDSPAFRWGIVVRAGAPANGYHQIAVRGYYDPFMV